MPANMMRSLNVIHVLNLQLYLHLHCICISKDVTVDIDLVRGVVVGEKVVVGGTLYSVQYSGYSGYIGYSTIWWGYTVLYDTVDTIDTLWREYFLKGERKPSRYKSEENSFVVHHNLFHGSIFFGKYNGY